MESVAKPQQRAGGFRARSVENQLCLFDEILMIVESEKMEQDDPRLHVT
jgi:hypothetical protein